MSATFEMINEAFRAIMANDADAARRLLARVQVAEYGGKPWAPGLPERDATDQAIVYEDWYWRFTVALSEPDGSHVRHFQGPNGGTAFRFEVRAKSAAKGVVMAGAFVKERRLHEARYVAGEALPNGWVSLVYHHGRSLD